MRRIFSKLLKTSQLEWEDDMQDVDWGDRQSSRPVTNENLSDYLIDDLEQPSGSNILMDTTEPEQAQPDIQQPELLGIPENASEINYASPQKLVYDGIDRKELVAFDYTTRYGMFIGRRTLEPHYTFIATGTGNEIVVGYDRSVNEIRAFIIGNIHPYGVRYENLHFTPKPSITTGMK